MMKKQKILLGLLILVVTSLGFIGDDILKFLLVGQSDTYNILLIRHNDVVVLVLSIMALFFNFYPRENSISKYLFGICLVLLVVSLKTYAVVETTNKREVVSGFSFIPLKKCKIREVDNCDVKFGFFLNSKLGKTISN